MFVGETGVGRVIQKTCEVMNEHGFTTPTTSTGSAAMT